jgi:hypothetical protein
MMKNGIELESIDGDLAWFGYDPYAPHPSEIETSDVVVNDCDCPFTEDEQEILASVDVLRHSQSFGIDIFIEALQLLNLSHPI